MTVSRVYFPAMMGMILIPCCVFALNPLQEMVASNYNFSSWVGGTNGYDRRVQNWSLPDLTIQTNGLNCRAVMYKWNYEERLHVFDLNCKQTIVDVDSVVCTNCCDARQAIIKKLASCTSTIRWQRYMNQLGDVAFYYPFGTNINALVFSRNNIMISIHSYVDYLSATNVAYQIDADILSKSRRE